MHKVCIIKYMSSYDDWSNTERIVQDCEHMEVDSATLKLLLSHVYKLSDGESSYCVVEKLDPKSEEVVSLLDRVKKLVAKEKADAEKRRKSAEAAKKKKAEGERERKRKQLERLKKELGET